MFSWRNKKNIGPFQLKKKSVLFGAMTYICSSKSINTGPFISSKKRLANPDGDI